MKRILTILFILVILGVFGWTALFLYNKSEVPPVVYETASPIHTDIVQKTVATGSIVPRKEVVIKPRVSGILEELFVEAGDQVKKGQLIARIRIVPNVVNLNNAEASVKTAKINYRNAQKEYKRYQQLLRDSVISEVEFRPYSVDLDLRKEELNSVENNLQLIREGVSKGSGKVSNQVRSTVSGMVLEVPVKEGGSVIESNNFNEGTTIASVADMKDMIFEGKVDESEVNKISVGMSLDVKVGAIEKARFKGELEHISPKGVEEQGAKQFEVRARMFLKEGSFLRAGYSANADIVLDRRDSVLALPESLLQFEEDKAYVEVETGKQQFEKRYVELGLSDGINIELKTNLGDSVRIKKP